MGSLLLLIVVLGVAVLTLSILIYKQQKLFFLKLSIQQQMMAQLDSSIREIAAEQQLAQKRLAQLAKDVMQRDIYRNADERHQLAIQSARQGLNVIELMQRYGLSSDEATLIISMHSTSTGVRLPSIENANLTDPNVAEVI